MNKYLDILETILFSAEEVGWPEWNKEESCCELLAKQMEYKKGNIDYKVGNAPTGKTLAYLEGFATGLREVEG